LDRQLVGSARLVNLPPVEDSVNRLSVRNQQQVLLDPLHSVVALVQQEVDLHLAHLALGPKPPLEVELLDRQHHLLEHLDSRRNPAETDLQRHHPRRLSAESIRHNQPLPRASDNLPLDNLVSPRHSGQHQPLVLSAPRPHRQQHSVPHHSPNLPLGLDQQQLPLQDLDSGNLHLVNLQNL
jgi:hypothetical protein